MAAIIIDYTGESAVLENSEELAELALKFIRTRAPATAEAVNRQMVEAAAKAIEKEHCE
ncbi:hypothetical protein [Pontibacter pamirensis]|uniref:hypothetical protein n=1 Tax=Pontibacter pamirensis TaxID=2562824 RepID=UPI00138964B9|nr:hypothetical protein [Pontibacter pamirensis]